MGGLPRSAPPIVTGGSERLRRYAREHVTRDAGYRASLDELPAWAALEAFEARAGGLVIGRDRFGVGWWQARGAPLFAAGAIGPIFGADILVLVCDRDLDNGVLIDEAGGLWAGDASTDERWPLASGLESYLERRALYAELERGLEPGDDAAVCAPGHIGAELAAALGIPAIAEASDAVRRVWSDGALAVAESHAYADAGAPATWLRGRGLVKAAAVARQIAKRPLEVVGWPNQRTSDLRGRLRRKGLL